MGMPSQQPTNETTFRIPVIIQALPDLRYSSNEWMANNDRQIAIGSIPIAVLSKLYQVDRVNRETIQMDKRCQREPIVSRINSLKRELQAKRVDLPTAILLNLRTYDELRHILDASTVTELVLNSDDHLFVVDGQHRVESLVRLHEEDPEVWGNYSVPFVCLLGADLNGENDGISRREQ